MISIRKNTLRKITWYLVFSFITILLTLYFYPIYTSGDLLHYNNFYNNVNEYTISQAFPFYKASLGTQEPIYFLTTYVLSNYITKLTFSILANVIITILIVRIIFNSSIQISMIFFAIAFYSCFYILVLFIPADRLKLALLIYLLGLNTKSIPLRYFWFALSILTHVQTILLVLADFSFNYLGRFFKSFKIKKTALYILILGAIALVFIGFILFNHVIGKYNAYTNMDHSFNGGIDSVIKTIVFMYLSIFIAFNKKVEIILMFIPLIISSYIIGEERIIIFCFFIFVSLLIHQKTKIKYLIYLPFLGYYSLSSYRFIMNIIQYGNGFPISN